MREAGPSGYDRALVRLAGHSVETALHIPAKAKGAVVLAHGRINDLDHPALLAAAQGAHQAGWATFRFNFPYRRRGEAHPDPFPVLARVHAAAARWALGRPGLNSKRLVLAGKSLGARTAVQAATDGTEAEGLLFLGYPLHPTHDPDSLRDKPLHGPGLPMGIIQGDTDALCDLEILRKVMADLRPTPELTVIPGADHGFGIPRGDHNPPPQTLEAIGKAAFAWLKGLG